MSDKDKRRGVSYELALNDVRADFDPLPISRNPNPDTRLWVLESQAADILGLTKKALERRRTRSTGPAHHQRMGFTAYYLDDLDAWVATKPKGYKPPPE
jgi:hypothetical protein